MGRCGGAPQAPEFIPSMGVTIRGNIQDENQANRAIVPVNIQE
jgi:hypothetical protein